MTKNRIIAILFFVLATSSALAQISMKKEQGGLWITDGGKNVAFYQKDPMGFDAWEKRNNFLHPLMLPDGTTITENAPDDHLHHRGVFWAWHQILIDGKQVSDGWDLKNFAVAVKGIEFKQVGGNNGELQTTALWSSPLYKNGDEAYMKEVTSYTFRKQRGNYRVIHFSICLTALVDGLELGGSNDEKGYGGFSVRLKMPADARFLSATGPVQPENAAVPAGSWVEISGSMAKNGQGAGGVLIYANPKNPEPNESWILRQQASMQNAAFPGQNPVKLEKGVPLVLDYTLVVFTGKIKGRNVLKEIVTDDVRD